MSYGKGRTSGETALISTLHRYLTWELVRTALLATGAFTLVMTMFAIIEPMRRQGLSPGQVLRLFWYLLPVALSLTLPIATLMSATMVYGRFSMDNELTACRASGISVYSLLAPGLTLALAVSLASLLLSNWIAPELAHQGEVTGKASLRGLVYQKLRRTNYVTYGHWVVHADQCEPDKDILRGVVALDTRRTGDARYLVASLAYVDFTPTREGVTDVTFTLVNASFGRQSDSRIGETAQLTIGPYPLRSFVEDDPMFYSWAMLRAIRKDPLASPVVRRKLDEIRRLLYATRLYEEMAQAISVSGSYRLEYRDGRYYVFRAPAAHLYGRPWPTKEEWADTR